MREWRATVDGRAVSGLLTENATLAEAVREIAGETALKVGCGEGMCGACSALLDGQLVHACCTPAFRALDCDIQTGASFGDGPVAHAIVAHGGLQCGFCTPGALVALHAMPDGGVIDHDAVRRALGANLCRCTGYAQLVEGAVAGLSGRTDSAPPAASGPIVGTSRPPIDGLDRASGRVRYLTDVTMPGMLHGAVMRSPHAHARVLSIDASRALALPGVHAVVCPDDAPEADVASEPFYGASLAVRRVLWDEPRWVGAPVVAVAADSREIAEAACRLVDVCYEPLPHVLDLEAALAPDAPEAIEGCSNFALPSGAIRFEQGDVDSAFIEAAHVVETVYRTHTVQAAALEPYCALVEPHEEGGLTVWKGTPEPFELRRSMSEWLGVPAAKIRVRVPAAIGGGFGSRVDDLELVAALLAMRAQRPVKVVLERAEGFLAGRVRHGAKIVVRSALDAAFNLLGRELCADYDAGAHLDLGPFVILRALRPLALYRCDAVRFVGRLVSTNKPVASATRGFGNPQATFAVESHVDEICRRFALDPVGWRRSHLLRSGDPNFSVGVVDVATGTFIPKGVAISSCGIDACLDVVERALSEDPGPPPPGLARGKGLAVGMHTTGTGRREIASARVTLRSDGTVELRSGSPDQGGTGVATTFAMIAADTLGVPLPAIDVYLADTADELDDSGAHASSRTYVGGEAVRQAAEAVRMRRDAGEALPISASVRFSPESNAPPFAACGAVIDVDPDTGASRVVRLVLAADIGPVLHPMGARGQLQGAVAQGVGFALSERLDFDALGQLTTRGLLDYGLPRAGDVPTTEVHFVGEPEPTLPLGVKGAGEIGIMPIAPAIANAIHDAIGVRVRTLPMDGETVWRAREGLPGRPDGGTTPRGHG